MLPVRVSTRTGAVLFKLRGGFTLTKKILFSGGLAVFLAYCYFYIAATAPANKPGELSGAQWPQGLIILLEIFLVINIINIIRATPKAERNFSDVTSINFKAVLKNRLFLGLVILFVFAFSLEYLGFLLGTFLFTIAYAYLLGEHRLPRLALYSLIITIALYVLFSLALDVMLPRGVGPLRDFALMLESI